MADVSTSGAIGALNDKVVLQVGRTRVCGIEVVVPTAFSGTLTIQGTYDGATPFNATCTGTDDTTATNTLTAAGRRKVVVSGMATLVVNCTAYTSGGCTVTISGSP